MKTHFYLEYKKELSEILPWPNHPNHPVRMSADELVAADEAARALRAARKSELDALRGWQDLLNDDPIIGPAMGRYSAAGSLLDEIYNEKNRRSNLN